MMNTNDEEYSRVWDRFEKLAAASEADRQRTYCTDGRLFLDALLKFTTVHSRPEILSADDFSRVVIELRDDYRKWNRYLMSLMASYDESEIYSQRERFGEFVSNCIWVVLVEAAQDFISSHPRS